MPNNKIVDVAKNIINISNDNGYELSNLKLNNLLYIVQCESYRRYGEPMFVEEMTACSIGVRNYDVYVRYLGYGASNISKEDNVKSLSIEDIYLLTGIIKVFAKINVWDLIEIVKQTTPWSFTWEIFNGKIPIKNDFIKTSFWENKKYYEF